jgi:hypothetical protein
MNRTFATLVTAVTVLAAVSCCCCGSGFDWDKFVQITPLSPVKEETPVPQVTPIITREPAGELGAETEKLLETTDVPERDLHDLAIRLRGLPADTPRTVNPGGSPDYALGTRRLFHASNVDTDEQFDVYDTLEYKTDHVYMWVEEGESVDLDRKSVV